MKSLLKQGKKKLTRQRLMNKHPYHLVDPSPWPITAAFGAYILVAGLARGMHKFDSSLLYIGLSIIVLTIAQWWRDVSRESTFQGKHTHKVENGLRSGMILFIVSEVFFFISFFWAFYHSSLSPNVDVGSIWPPKRIETIDPFGVPLLNTTILLSSGATITWSHMSIIRSKWLETNVGIASTINLGVIFTALQVLEYESCTFTMADSIYGSTFFLATGFHGLHVIFGTLFISSIWWRHNEGHFSATHHFGFEGRAWYWHFVDVVWLFLFVRVYWWGY